MNKNKLTRRDFLKMAGVTSAGLALSACGVDVTKLPDPTVTASITPFPTATQTPIPTPETLASLKDLEFWIDDFVNAHGGTIKVNETNMNARELTNKIRTNPESFTQTKLISSKEYSFLMVNDVPIGIAGGDKKWSESSLRILAELKGIELEFAWAGDDFLRQHNISSEKYVELSKLIGNSFIIGGGVQTQQVFQNFTTQDWQRVIKNWNDIKGQLQSNKVPSGYPYYLDYGKEMIRQVTIASVNENPKMRGLWLMHLGNGLDSIIKGSFSSQELSIILEFIIKSIVLSFPEINRWDATDELVNAYVTEDPDLRFWYQIFGKSPAQTSISDVADLMIVIAQWIKEANQNAEVIITEDAILDFNNAYAPWSINAFNDVLENISSKSQAHLFKGIDCEFNLWVYDGLDIEKMKANLDKWNNWGFHLYGSETMIVTGDTSIQRRTSGILSGKVDPIEQQDLMYKQLFQFYLDAQAPTFGFGELGDMDNWLEMGDDPLYNTAPGIFDVNYRKKSCYFVLAKTLFENL